MTSPQTRFPAECDSCGQTFQVPDPSKTYGCKACDEGRVQAMAPCCPECDEAVAYDDQFCERCGASLAEQAESEQNEAAPQASMPQKRSRPKPGAARSRAGGRARSSRRAVSGELNRALKSVRVLRTFFVINAVIHLLLTAASVSGFGFTGGDRTVFVISLAIQASMSAIMLAGVFLVMHQPAVWALVMACIVTLSRLMSAWEFDWNIGVLGIGAIWSLAFWALVAPAARAKRLMDENPDLAYAKRLESQRPRAMRNALVSGGGVVVVSVAAAFFLHVGSAAVPLGPTWKQFVDDWQADRSTALYEWVESGMGESARAEFELEARSRGWSRDLPSLPADQPGDLDRFELYSIDDFGSGSESIECETSEGTFGFHWSYDEDAKDWNLRGLDYPQAPFPQELLDRIELAWSNDDLESITSVFENPDSARRSVGSAFERRGWERDFPELRGIMAEPSTRGVNVYLDTVAGEVRIRFQRSEGAFKATSFKPPPR